MKIALMIVGALLLVIALVVTIGAALPKGHVARRRARFQKPAAQIFAVISDFAAMPSWRPGVQRVELLPAQDGKQRYRESGKDGAITYQVEALEPPRFLRTRITDELPYGGTWTLEVEPNDSSAILTITEDGEVYNPVFRFVSRLLLGHTATMDTYLKALAAKLGEPLALLE